jgi:dipeptidyl aminopeptidase/acylaminoacyl peptidase
MMVLALALPGLLCVRVEATEPAPPAKPVATQKLTATAFAQLPFVEQPKISPSGNRFAGLMGINGRQLITIMNIFDRNEKPVTVPLGDTVQVESLTWVNDDNIIVVVHALDNVMAQRFYVYRAVGINRLTGKVTKLLWDSGGQNAADVIWIPADGSNSILMGAQNSVFYGQDFWRSVYRIDVTNGHRSVIQRGIEGVMGWVADSSGVIRSGLAYRDDTRTFRLLYRSENGRGGFRTIDRADTRKREGLTRPFLFLPGGDLAMVVHDDDKGNSAIFEVDMTTLKDVRLVYAAPEGEIDDVILSDDGRTLLGVTTTAASESVYWIDPALAELQAQFNKAVPNAKVHIKSLSRDRQRMLVSIAAPDMAGMIYYYDVGVGRLQKLAVVNDTLGARRLSPVKAIQYKARDGLEIEGILTLPKDRDARNLPFVLMPHGGPWSRDGLTYDYWAQFIASLGYAVLQPNFRGSTGYGTEFERKGEGQMGLAMQDDLTDGVRWAVREGIADPKRVCIVGASYGGYAAMWGVAREPDFYRCAISIAGVANLRREVNDFGGYVMEKKYRDDWQRMTPDFAAVSPYNFVPRIKAPLLLVHGKKDITVEHGQSASMYGRMREAGKDVEFLSLPQADHYYTREADRLALLQAIEKFLAKHNPPDQIPATTSTAGAGNLAKSAAVE